MPRILIVDDDDAVRAAVTLMIKSLGHECVAVRSTAEAIAAAEDGALDLALIDMLMPDLDGLEAVKAIVHIEPRIPIIAMSGGSASVSSGDYAVLAVKMGAAMFVQKPFTRAQLAEAFAKVLPG